jgi:hypothetical protein
MDPRPRALLHPNMRRGAPPLINGGIEIQFLHIRGSPQWVDRQFVLWVSQVDKLRRDDDFPRRAHEHGANRMLHVRGASFRIWSVNRDVPGGIVSGIGLLHTHGNSPPNSNATSGVWAKHNTRHLDKSNIKSTIVPFYTDLRNDGFYHSVGFLLL